MPSIKLLHRVLTRRGHDVTAVSDGEAALEALKANHYDVAILDFH
ncbi:MAG TPA: hypothetical protein DCQ79_00330 [Rhizobiales bacterium]|nr:hypothetical protein [Hyphomicrobiales bacterium]